MKIAIRAIRAPYKGLAILIVAWICALSIFPAIAQPRRVPPAPVPDAVVMPRPDEAEIGRAEALLTSFMDSLGTEDEKLFSRYPFLLEVSPPGINTAIIPALNPRFQEKHEANLDVARGGNIDVLFMGDSITDWWRTESGPYAGKPVFDEYFADMKVANFGIAGDTTQGVLYRLQNGEGEGYTPRAIMLMIGTNNTRANLAGEIAEGVGAIVLDMQTRWPQAKILLLGIFPRSTPDNPVREKLAQINTVIARLDDGERVFYRDIGAIFLDAKGEISTDIMSDGLHPTTRGYRLWAEAVIDPLREMLK
ncbi:MAG: GDSL-type esterase/lipase family protein [Gammaproteobacteria bacterium]|nr:GDSL-type esterase/lipase family protein [Gammaproteobacteria bacterium]